MGEKRKENRQTKFRVNDLEFQRLEQMATESGMSVFIRNNMEISKHKKAFHDIIKLTATTISGKAFCIFYFI